MGLQWKVPEACEPSPHASVPQAQAGTNQQGDLWTWGADTALRLDYSRLCSGAVTSFLTTARSIRKMRSLTAVA